MVEFQSTSQDLEIRLLVPPQVLAIFGMKTCQKPVEVPKFRTEMLPTPVEVPKQSRNLKILILKSSRTAACCCCCLHWYLLRLGPDFHLSTSIVCVLHDKLKAQNKTSQAPEAFQTA